MKLTIYRKMLMGFGFMILVMIAVNAYLLFALHTLSDTVATLLLSDVQSLDVAKQLRSSLADEERHASKYAISGDTTYLSLFTETAAHTEDQFDSLGFLVAGTPSQEILRRFHAAHGRLAGMVHGARGARFRLPVDAIADSVEVLHGHLDLLIAGIRQSMGTAVKRLETTTEQSLRLALLITLVALFGTVAVAFVITRTITRPLEELRAETDQIGRGIFKPIRIHSRDEIALLANAFNDMSARLRKSNDQRAEMMQQISHEIRMPLQSMHAALYLLARESTGPATDAQRKLFTTIRNNIERIAGFSDQFLDLAKIEAGMMEFHFEEADLVAILTAAVETAQPAATAKGITLHFSAAPVPPSRVDERKIQQAITNLLSNALKYTSEGGTVTLELGPSPQGIRIAISDTGVGIHPDDLPNLFTKFFQARHTSTGGTKGTGLGLALVKAIVERHGGTVSATSTPGHGSTFAVDLPLSPQATTDS